MRTDLLAGRKANIRERKQLRRQRQRQKANGFMSKTTVLTLFSTFLKLTSTAPLRRETSQCDVFNRTWTYDDKFSFSLYEHVDKVLKNSAPRKVANI